MTATLPALSRACNVTRHTATDAPQAFVIVTRCEPLEPVAPLGVISTHTFVGTEFAARRYAGLLLIRDHARFGYEAVSVDMTSTDGAVVYRRKFAARGL